MPSNLVVASARAHANIHFMIDNVPGNTFQDKLNHLANCNCCERHQLNKPILFVHWYDTSFSNNQLNNPCTCNCRHIARFICRQTIVPPPPTRVNSPTSVIDF